MSEGTTEWELHRRYVLELLGRLEKGQERIEAKLDALTERRGAEDARLADMRESLDDARHAIEQFAEQFRDAAIARRLDLVTEAVFTLTPRLNQAEEAIKNLDGRVQSLQHPMPAALVHDDDEPNGSGGHA